MVHKCPNIVAFQAAYPLANVQPLSEVSTAIPQRSSSILLTSKCLAPVALQAIPPSAALGCGTSSSHFIFSASLLMSAVYASREANPLSMVAASHTSGAYLHGYSLVMLLPWPRPVVPMRRVLMLLPTLWGALALLVKPAHLHNMGGDLLWVPA